MVIRLGKLEAASDSTVIQYAGTSTVFICYITEKFVSGTLVGGFQNVVTSDLMMICFSEHRKVRTRK